MKTGKTIALMLVTVLALLLSGCGSGETGSAPEPPAAEPLPVVEAVVIEAGDPVPTAAELLPSLTESSAACDTSAVDTHVPGTYRVTVTADGRVGTSLVTVKDTVPPVMECCGGYYCRDGFEAKMLVTDAADETELRFSLAAAPLPEICGPQTVTVIAEDLGGNKTSCDVEITLFDYALFCEASSDPVTAEALRLLIGAEEDGESAGGPDGGSEELLLPGGFTGEALLELPAGDAVYVILFHAADTLPPAAEPAPYEGYTGYELPAESLVTDVRDATAVTVEYLETPDWNEEGSRDVSLLLTDESGNSTEVTVPITLRRDTEPPRIYMARDFYGYADTTVRYFGEIFAVDGVDPDVVLEVDKSQVNPREPGRYPVTYTATDRAGNSAEATVYLTLVRQTVSDETLDAAARAVLDSIVTEDMNTAEKVQAVYNWAHENMFFFGTSDKTDFNGEAYRALTTLTSDCFGFYSAVYSLLSRIEGVEVLSVQRWKSARQNSHYWCLVNVEGTGWYHLDAINVLNGADYKVFMRTTEELLAHGDQYWKFDQSLYPATNTESFRMDWFE